MTPTEAFELCVSTLGKALVATKASEETLTGSPTSRFGNATVAYPLRYAGRGTLAEWKIQANLLEKMAGAKGPFKSWKSPSKAWEFWEVQKA